MSESTLSTIPPDKLEQQAVNSVVEELRRGEIPPSPDDAISLADYLAAITHSPSLPGDVREQALLGLYYLSAREPDDTLVGLLDELLWKTSEDAHREPEEHLRGRKHWLRIVLMTDEGRSAEEVVGYLCSISADDEPSSFVWERVFAALSNWSNIEALYPLPSEWRLPKELPETFYKIQRKAERTVRRLAGSMVRLRRNVLRSLDEIAGGKRDPADIHEVLEDYHGEVRRYVAPPEEVEAMIRLATPVYRNALFSVLTQEATNEDLPLLSDYRDALDHVTAESEDYADRLTRFAMHAIVYGLGGEGASEYLIREAIELTATLPEEYQLSQNRYAVYQAAGHTALALVSSDRSAEVPVGAIRDLLVSAASPKQRDNVYLALTAAGLFLAAARRSDTDVSKLVAPAEALLSLYPDAKGPLSTGEDIKPGEIGFPEAVPHLESASQAEAAQTDEDEDSFFNPAGLTSLLESCQPPHVSWRLSQGLSELRVEAPAIGLALAKPGGAPEELSGPQDSPGESPEGTRRINPQQPGPFMLSEIIEAFKEMLPLGSDDEVESYGEEIAHRLDERLRLPVRQHQRELIQRVFEGAHGDNRESESPFVRIAQRIFQSGFEARGLRLDPIPGNPEGGVDALAYYRPESMLPKESQHQYGIYFRARSLLAFFRSHGLGISPLLEAVLESVAVHELFHYFIEEQLGDGYRKMWSRHPSGFRPLEEAAADRYGSRHLESLETNGGLSATQQEMVRRALFPTRIEGGLEGYGDYPLIDNQAAQTVPEILSEYSALPSRYASESALLLANSTLRSHAARDRWQALVEGRDCGIVPMYLDFLS